MKDLVKIGNSFNIPLKTYIADFEEDLDIILKEEKPPVGSIVEVINTGIYKRYKLGNDLKWYEIPIESSGGGCNPEDYKLQEKNVVPSTAAQIVTPDANYYGLSKVNVDKIPKNYITTDDANATPEDLMIGKTAYVQGQKITGTKEDETYVLPLASENELGGIKASEKDELDVQECKINTENGKLYTQSFEDLLIVDKIEGNPAMSNSSAEWTIKGLRLYGESSQNITTGKNLIPENGSWGFQPAIFGSSFNNGIWKISNKMPFGNREGILALSFPEDGEYTISLQSVSPDQKIYLEKIFQQNTTQVTIISNLEKNKTFSVSNYDSAQYQLRIEVPERTTIQITHLQLEKGSEATSYEFYSNGIPSPSPTYPQQIFSKKITKIMVTGGEGQKNIYSFSSPVSLHGLQTEKGNININNKKFLSDILDEDKIIRYIGCIESYNQEEVGDIWKSTTGQLTTGATVIYPLAEPTIEYLSEEESQALKGIKTFYPTSIISGVTEDGQGIWVQSDIVCDPKNYINNETEKIKNEIQSQLLSTYITLLEEI